MQKRTLQAVFKRVAIHLLTQGKPAYLPSSSYNCAYRGENDTKCAVGCLIKNKHYSGDLEGNSVDDDAVVEAVLASCPSLGAKNDPYNMDDNAMAMLATLQNIHDTSPPSRWRSELRKTAKRFGLDYTPVYEATKK